MAHKERSDLGEPLDRSNSGRGMSTSARTEGPTAAEFVASLSREHIDNMTWALENADELTKYEGRWVVIAGQRIFCSGHSLEDVEQQALRAGLDRRDILVEYVYPFDITLSCPARR